jgi:hypothetical protein
MQTLRRRYEQLLADPKSSPELLDRAYMDVLRGGVARAKLAACDSRRAYESAVLRPQTPVETREAAYLSLQKAAKLYREAVRLLQLAEGKQQKKREERRARPKAEEESQLKYAVSPTTGSQYDLLQQAERAATSRRGQVKGTWAEAVAAKRQSEAIQRRVDRSEETWKRFMETHKR